MCRSRRGAARWVHEKAAALPLRAFEQESYYTKLETAQQVDGDSLSDLLDNLSWFLSSVVGVAGLMALYVRAHWLLAVVLVATVALRAHRRVRHEPCLG